MVHLSQQILDLSTGHWVRLMTRQIPEIPDRSRSATVYIAWLSLGLNTKF